MRILFIGVAFFTVITLIVFMVISIRQKKYTSRFMYAIHLIIASAIVFCLVPMFTSNKIVATIFTCLYYLTIDWLLLAFSDFLIAFTDTDFDLPLVKLFRTDALILAVMDSALILSTIYTDFTFTLVEKLEDGVFVGWKEIHESGFTVHSIFDYVVSSMIGVFLVNKLIISPKFHKQKIIILLSCFLLLMIANMLLMNAKVEFRYTIISYAIISIVVSDLAFHFVPRQIESKIRTLIAENLNDGVVCFNANGKCIFMNKSAIDIFGTKENCYEKYVAYNALGFDVINLKEQFETKGELRSFDITSNRLRDSQGRRIGTFMTFRDTTDEIENLKNEVYRSTHDYLTNLLNRAAFFKSMELTLKMEPTTQRYLICTDIRNFKLINDLFGNKLGDKILKTQAKILNSIYDDDGIVGRISGDKFAILVRKESFNYKKLIDELSQLQNLISAAKFKIQVDIGVYEIADPYENVITMYDKANLSIKNSQFTQAITFYDTSIMESLIYEKQIIGMFDAAIKGHQFKMYLQPQISSKTRNAVGAEALVRWIHPERAMIPPSDFVPILEKSGHIYKLDHFIWECAAKKLAEWQNRGIDLHIAVNISTKDFYYLDLFSIFTKLIDKYKISPQKLKLEITETALMYDMKSHSQVLRKLQEFGFSIEMDDFGSGYSSLNMLRNLKMDVLKIDMAFLKKTDNLNRSQIIINSIIKMAKSLGMTIITEGVEEESHVEFLSKAGCDIFQGFYYSRPISIEDFEEKFLTREDAE